MYYLSSIFLLQFRKKRSIHEFEVAKIKLRESIEKKNPIGSRKYSSGSSEYGGNSRERRPPIGEPPHRQTNFQSKNKKLLEILKPVIYFGDSIEDNGKEADEYYMSLLSEKYNIPRQHGQNAPVNIMPHKYQLMRGKGRP